ncbi:MAG: hypothetical protein Q4A46_08915 [Clostridia bacterium]|nr:hypothetical protein [Clostridia bacterium]
MLNCPYCGSSRLQTTGGKNGNPFDRRREKTICLDCGRTVGTEPDLSELFQSVVCVEMTAEGGGLVRKAKAEFSFEDGAYDLSRLAYPLCRYKRLKISKDTVDIDDEIYVSITDVPYETTRQYTAYAPDKHPVAETVKIKIYSDVK